jgi:hypothetical protein
MNIYRTDIELSDSAKQAIALDLKFKKHIQTMSLSSPITYTDSDGYFVKRTPDGMIIRLSNVPRTQAMARSA